ncbi:hypothetical protein ASD15_25620 [Massilia sp. Root351]|uniref:TonB-dependent siderophore receptor n=1 Tax=Massilia sp. Root351 TaxID=1736522 RepID=UPI00070BAEEF|nr:TonB-dependent receptor [Massilia sp. Root351]KQV90055.1 hypothetical protein ASD15_25620 [Massilia sp. Root351]
MVRTSITAVMIAAAAAAPTLALAKDYQIAGGALSPALSRFAGQSGVTLSSNPALTDGLSTRGLQGNYGVAEGFAQLLEGSGLEAAQQGGGVYVLRKTAAAATAQNAAVMQQVTVLGQALGASTEGTGSYTSGAMRTATRMEMSVRDTPQSVSVITRARMDDLGISRLDEALAQTTGIMVGQQDSERTRYYARGFGINNIQVDGMPQGGNAPLSDTILYDRVEVVRGASGLMGGTGDPSAAINMVRKRPTRTLQGNAGVVLGRWDSKRVEADLSIPLAADGSVRGRAAVAHQERDSYMDMYQERKTVGMAIVEADLAERTLLTVGADFQHNAPKGSTWGAVPYWNSEGGLANLPRNFSLSAPWSTWANEQETVFASVDQRFANNWKLHAGYARTTSRNNTAVVNGGSGYPNAATGAGMTLWTGVWGEGEYVDDNFDVYATGPFSLLGRRHTLIAGWNGGNQTYTTQGGEADVKYPAKIPDYRIWTGNIPRPVFIPDGTRSEGVTRLTGAYLAGRFSLADSLTAIVGARISSYRTETRNFDSSGKHTGTTDSVAMPDERTPYVGLVLDLGDNLSAYASYTTLFNPQTSRDKNNNFLPPETGTNAELGIKGEYLNGRLNASAAAFQTKKKNLAELDKSVAPGFTLPDGGMAYVANGEGITARGLEFDLSGQVAAGWNLSAGYTWLDASEANGKRAVPTQPRHLLRLSGAYDFGGAWQGLKLGAGITAQSATYGESWYGRPKAPKTEEARLEQGAYALVSAMASYRINRQASVQLNISNLLDKHYYRNVGFYDSVFWGEPRNVSLSLNYRFQ